MSAWGCPWAWEKSENGLWKEEAQTGVWFKVEPGTCGAPGDQPVATIRTAEEVSHFLLTGAWETLFWKE